MVRENSRGFINLIKYIMNWAKFITNISLYTLMIIGIIIIVLFLILVFDINIENALVVSYIIFGITIIIGFIAEYNDKEKY